MSREYESILVLFDSDIINDYLNENGVNDVLHLYDEQITDDIGDIHLEKSFACSLANLVNKYLVLCEQHNLDEWEGVSVDELNDLYKFLLSKSLQIDKNITGSITIETSDDVCEDTYQSLRYENGKGELVYWNCKIEDEDSMSIDKIYSSGNDLYSYAKQNGKVTNFSLKNVESSAKRYFKQTIDWTNIENKQFINTSWIEGKIFVHTGFEPEDEEVIRNILGDYGGIVKRYVALKTDYLIYNIKNGTDTVKYNRALEVKKRGEKIQMLTEGQFYAMLCDM